MNGYFHWDRPRLHAPDKMWFKLLIFINVTLAAMATTIDLIGLLPTMFQIQGDLVIDSTKILFVPRLYMFSMAIGPLLSVRLGRRYGYKRVLFCAVWVFLLCAIGASLTDSYAFMLAMRLIGGLGGGAIVGSALPILNHHFSEEERPVFVALHSSIFFGLGIAIGLTIGGYFGQIQSWDWVFWLNGYICLFVLLITLLFHGGTDPEEAPPFDFKGLISISAACLFLFYIVSQVKAPWMTNGWYNPIIFFCGLGAAASLTYFISHSLTDARPLFNLRLLAIRPFALSMLGITIVGFMVFGVTMSSTLMLQQIYGFQHWQLGLFMSQIGYIYFVVGGIVSYLIYYINPRIFVLLGLALIAIACFHAQTITIQSTRFELAVSMWIRSIGVAMTLGPITVWGTASLPKELYPKGSSLLAFARQMSGVFGSSIISLIAYTRTPLHSLRYGEQAAESMGATEKYLAKLKVWASSSGNYLSEKHSQEMLRQWIENQAQIQGLIDAEYVLGWVTFAVFCVLASTMSVAFYRDRKKRSLLISS